MLPVIKASAGFSTRVSRCMVKEILPSFRYVTPYFRLQLRRADALLGLLHRVDDEGLGDDDDFCALFCCAAETSKTEEVDCAAHSSFYHALSEHR